jgi:hypothetical protein
MNVVRRTQTELSLQERPWLAWLVGLLFITSGSYVALLGGEPVFGGAFAAIGVGAILAFGDTVTCTFDLKTGQFTRESRGPRGTRQVQYALKEIVGVRVARSVGRSQTFRVELVRASGDRVPLTSSYSSGKGDKQESAELIRGFLELSDPGEVPTPGFRQLLRMAINPAAHPDVSADYDTLIADYEAEIRRNPGNVEAHRNLAMALAFQNRPDKARARLEDARAQLARDGEYEVAAQFEAVAGQIRKASGP